MDKMIVNQLPIDSLRGKRVLLRLDASADPASADFVDEYKLRLSLPTIKQLLPLGARIIIGTHIGNPGGKTVERLRVGPVAEALEALTGKTVHKLDESTGENVLRAVTAMKEGEIVLLENLLFNPGEESNDAQFAHELSILCDLYCNDAFALAHLGLASTVGITHYVRPAVAGPALARELMMFEVLLSKPNPPFLGIIAGARIEEKLSILENLITTLDRMFVGGALSFTFLKAQGYEVGAAPVSEAFLPLVKDILRRSKGVVDVVLPKDFTVVHATRFKEFTESGGITAIPDSRQVPADELLPSDLPVDIGPQTLDLLYELIDEAHTVFWNGPLGVWETEPFCAATQRVTRALIERSPHHVQRTVISGDSLARAIRTSGLPVERIRHLTTGGQAALQLLAGNPLPSIAALDDAGSVIEPFHRRTRRILLAVDGSDNSLEAAERLGVMVEPEDVEITLLYVPKSRTLFNRSGRNDPEAAQQRSIERRFEIERVFSAANAALARQGLVSHRMLAIEGDPADEILKCADEMEVDLIAMGAHVKSGLRSFAGGNLSRKVTKRSSRPVLIVRVPDEDSLLQKAG